MGEVKRFIPKEQRVKANVAADIASKIGLFDLDQLPEQPREAMLNALHRHIHDPNSEGLWPGGFTMLSRTQTAAIWKAIRQLPPDARPGHVRHAFDLALLNLRQDTGEIMLTRDQLAEEIGCSVANVSRVMGTLEDLGVIRRERRKVDGMQGRGMAVYFVNPHVAWNGDLTLCKRRAAETSPPLLNIMQGGKA